MVESQNCPQVSLTQKREVCFWSSTNQTFGKGYLYNLKGIYFIPELEELQQLLNYP